MTADADRSVLVTGSRGTFPEKEDLYMARLEGVEFTETEVIGRRGDDAPMVFKRAWFD